MKLIDCHSVLNYLFSSAIKKLNALELLPSKPYNLQTIHEPAATTEERIGIAVPMKYAPPVEKVSYIFWFAS